MIVNLLAQLGSWVLSLLSSVGRFGIFSGRVLARLGGAGLSPIISQIHFIGNYSLLIISVSGLFVGFVLGLQGYYVLVTYGSEEALGTLVALSLVRELGPVVTALLFAGRAGTALTAEIGLMRSGEQLAAMEMMGVDPIRRVFAPRFIGGFISMPILALIFSAVGIIGAWMVGVLLIGTDNGAFWSQMESAVDVFSDICNGFVKSRDADCALSRLGITPDAGRCCPCDHYDGRSFLSSCSRARFHHDGLDVHNGLKVVLANAFKPQA